MTDKPVTETDLIEPDPRREYTIREVCHVCKLDVDGLYEWVVEGVIQPRGEGVTAWRFSPRQLQRARTARRLQRDLAINTTGLPLVLDLVEEVKSLRTRLRLLERQLLDEE